MPHFKCVGSEEAHAALSVLRPGIMDSFFEIMYTRFNHTVEVILINSESSEKINNTWTGVVAALIRGEADVSVFHHSCDPQMAEEVAIQHIAYTDAVGILSKEKYSESVGDVMGILSDVEAKVWFSMALVLLTVTILNRTTAILISKPEEKPIIQLDNNLLTLFGMMLYYGSSRVPKHVCTRILLQFYLFSTIIFVCYLYANMKSNCTIIRPKIYKTIEDVLKDEEINPVLFDIGYLTKMLQNSQEEYQEFLKKVSTPPGRIIKHVMKFALDGPQAYRQLVKMNQVWVGDIATMNILSSATCSHFNNDVALVEEKLRGQLKFLFHRKNLEPVKALHLKKISRYLVETGVYFRWADQLKGEIPLCVRKSGDSKQVETESLMLASLFNAGIFWAIGLLVSGLCLVVEIGFHKFMPNLLKSYP